MTHIRPTLEYACQVWHCDADESDAIALERVQASIARSILHADWHTPKSDLLKALDWPSLRWRRTILCMKLFHLLLHNRCGPVASCLYPFSRTSLRKPKQLLLPRVRTARRTKSFFFFMSSLWNTLPSDLQNIEQTSRFMAALECHWEKYKYSVNEFPRQLIKQFL